MKIRFLFAKKRQDKEKITYKRFPFFFFFLIELWGLWDLNFLTRG